MGVLPSDIFIIVLSKSMIVPIISGFNTIKWYYVMYKKYNWFTITNYLLSFWLNRHLHRNGCLPIYVRTPRFHDSGLNNII